MNSNISSPKICKQIHVTESMFEEDLNYAKKQVGFQFEFKDKQLQALDSLYNCQDTVVVVPTGYGKSAIFQVLPYLMQRKFKLERPMIVIVVAPLNSIMQDQVQTLSARGVPACYIDIAGTRFATYTNDDDNETSFVTNVEIQDIQDGKYPLIYAHPETLLGSKSIGKMLRSKVYKELVCCTVVDEVHMISEWGTDFRKSFQQLGELTILYPDKPHLAMTATATKSAMESLTKTLQFEDPVFITENPDRPNIFIEVRERLPNLRKYEKQEKILAPLVTELKEKLLTFPVTVVYCDNLETVGFGYQYISSELGEFQYIPKEERIPENRIFAQYHKDYTEKMKSHIISELRKESPKVRLVLATVALGMGLNSPSIDRVIHTRPPTTLEKYLQEIGRAGRSGQKASAIVYFNNSDIAPNRKGLQQEVRDFVKNRTTCLRRHLLQYFGFQDTALCDSSDNCCSNCKARGEQL